MYTYLSTCISGTTTIIEEILRKNFPDLSVTLSLDGLVVYTTEAKPEQIKQLRGLNNSFLLIKMYKNSQPTTVEKLIKQTISEPKILQSITQSISPKQFTFRIVTVEKNSMVSVSQSLIKQLEERIVHRSHLKPNRRIPQNEIWFMVRSEGYSFIGIRLKKSAFRDKNLEKGELAPQLAYILTYLSDPSPFDIVLDPFAGHGAIPIERTNSKSKEILASDINPDTIKALIEKITKLNKNIKVTKADAVNLSHVPSGSVDKIITDPPWGLFDPLLNIPELYEKMFAEFTRVVKKDGIFILLTAQKEIVNSFLHEKFKNDLSLTSQYDILLSGKKATIFKFIKQQ